MRIVKRQPNPMLGLLLIVLVSFVLIVFIVVTVGLDSAVA